MCASDSPQGWVSRNTAWHTDTSRGERRRGGERNIVCVLASGGRYSLAPHRLGEYTTVISLCLVLTRREVQWEWWRDGERERHGDQHFLAMWSTVFLFSFSPSADIQPLLLFLLLCVQCACVWAWGREGGCFTASACLQLEGSSVISHWKECMNTSSVKKPVTWAIPCLSKALRMNRKSCNTRGVTIHSSHDACKCPDWLLTWWKIKWNGNLMMDQFIKRKKNSESIYPPTIKHTESSTVSLSALGVREQRSLPVCTGSEGVFVICAQQVVCLGVVLCVYMCLSMLFWSHLSSAVLLKHFLHGEYSFIRQAQSCVFHAFFLWRQTMLELTSRVESMPELWQAPFICHSRIM